jgi:DNA-binding CsgD family transcriptional regulator
MDVAALAVQRAWLALCDLQGACEHKPEPGSIPASRHEEMEAPMTMFSDIARHSLNALFTIDRDQRVTFWNQACEDLTGVSADDATGRPCHEILRGQDCSGRPFCGPDCPVARLSKGGPSPAKFSIRISAGEAGRVQLNVGTMLVPSDVEGEWMVAHFMQRGHCKSSVGSLDRINMGAQLNGKNYQIGAPGFSSQGVGLLTEREREILCLMAYGHTTDVISQRLHISVTTVRNHIQRLMVKLNVHSRVEAVSCAHRHQLV